MVVGATKSGWQGTHEAAGNSAGKTGIAAGQLLLAYRIRKDVQAHAAELFGEYHGGQTHFIGLFVKLGREFALDFQNFCGWDDLLVGKFVNHHAQILLKGSEQIEAGCRH